MKRPLTNAGNYNRAFSYFPVTYTTDPVSNAAIPSWPTSSVTYWGSLDEKGGTFMDARGTLRSITYATITLRQAATTISSEDRLVDLQFGHTYVLTTINVNWNTNETVIVGQRYQGDTI